jgi:hypothetical protein
VRHEVTEAARRGSAHRRGRRHHHVGGVPRLWKELLDEVWAHRDDPAEVWTEVYYLRH